jgi:hypothetical protein
MTAGGLDMSPAPAAPGPTRGWMSFDGPSCGSSLAASALPAARGVGAAVGAAAPFPSGADPEEFPSDAGGGDSTPRHALPAASSGSKRWKAAIVCRFVMTVPWPTAAGPLAPPDKVARREDVSVQGRWGVGWKRCGVRAQTQDESEATFGTLRTAAVPLASLC